MKHQITHSLQTLITVVSGLVLVACAKSGNDNLQDLSKASIATPPQTIAIKIDNYSPASGMQFQNLFVANYSTVVSQGQLFLSSARDGMSDVFKESLTSTYGFTINGPETAVTDFADLVLFDAGLKLSLQSSLACASSELLSTTNDAIIYQDTRLAGSPNVFLGLRDCEKVYMGLKPADFDFDGDGIPDYLELRCGLNPADKNDAVISSAGDGVENIDKCKMNIPIAETAASNQLFQYQYSTDINADGSRTFTISNIPVLVDNQDNFLAFYVTETGTKDQAPALYSAYAILPKGFKPKNGVFEFDYWTTSTGSPLNQEIVVP